MLDPWRLLGSRPTPPVWADCQRFATPGSPSASWSGNSPAAERWTRFSPTIRTSIARMCALRSSTRQRETMSLSGEDTGTAVSSGSHDPPANTAFARGLARWLTVWIAVSVVLGIIGWWFGEHPQRLAIEPTPLRQYVFLASLATLLVAAGVVSLNRRRRRGRRSQSAHELSTIGQHEAASLGRSHREPADQTVRGDTDYHGMNVKPPA